jgi:ribA/ribD-fused uncharacterized protein
MIDRFNGEHAFLSNFATSRIEMDGLTYPTVEHAYQAAKTLNAYQRGVIRVAMTPGKAKRLGKKVDMQPDFNGKRLAVMLELVSKKFEIPELADKLIATGGEELIEGNYWNDTYWGVCQGKGLNNLGIILMHVRHDIGGVK